MAALNCERAIDLVIAIEGGYVEHPLDPGGPTRFGITRGTLARARGRPAAAAEVMALSLEEARAIYRSLFWEAVRADELPGGVDLAVFDCAVNSGPRRAALILQRLLAVPNDGRIGPVTLGAALNAEPESLIRAYCAARLGFLARLPTAQVFGKGWRHRVARVERAALAMTPSIGADPASPRIPEKEKTMLDLKSILTSRMVWANVVGLGSVLLSAAGFDTRGIDAGAFSDALLQIVAGASFLLSTVFHIRQKRG